MVVENGKFNDENFLRIKRQQRKSLPNLISLYQNHVEIAFPARHPEGDLLVPNTFTGDDEIDYNNFHKIFEDSPWNGINLNLLYETYSQFSYLTDDGWFFYLPAFLSFFNDLTASNIYLFEKFVEKICDSNFILKVCNNLTAEQSKLVAIFLMNVASFSRDDYTAQMAQHSITSHWGTYLMF